MKLADLEIKSYIIQKGNRATGGLDITLEGVEWAEGTRWAIRKDGFCLSKDGYFELEPMPSDRVQDFFRRCRWSTAQEALDFYVEQGRPK